MKDLCILVSSNDEYIKAFGQIWMSCFETYWRDCAYPYMFVTEEYRPPLIQHFDAGKTGWNRRTLKALNYLVDRYNPEAVLLLHEDYLFGPQRIEGTFNANLSRCLQVLRDDKDVRTIGCVRKDPEIKPYDRWPEMLGVHDVQTQGILPVDPQGISLWRTSRLQEHLERVISKTPEDKDLGRNGVAEFSFLGSVWAREENHFHLRVKREIDYKDGILNVLLGVTIFLGRLYITDAKQLAIVEAAVGQKLDDMPCLFPLKGGKLLNL